MAYTKTEWQDRVVDTPNRYEKADESATEVTLISKPGTVTAEGTPISAANMNKIEVGISEAHAHIASKANPHNTTKAQVGLGSVQNYGIASQAQAEAGTSNSVYMTALRTKQAIENYGVPTRIHNGEYQYYNGSEWAPVGKSVINMTPKQINYYSTDNSLSTSASGLTIFSVNGKGVLSDFEAWFTVGGGSGQLLEEIGLIVEIDGVNHLLYQDGYDGANTLYRIAYAGGSALTRSTSTANSSRNVIKSHIQYGFSSSFKIKVRSKRSQSYIMIGLTGGYYLE